MIVLIFPMFLGSGIGSAPGAGSPPLPAQRNYPYLVILFVATRTPKWKRVMERQKASPSQCPVTQATGPSSDTRTDLAVENARLRE